MKMNDYQQKTSLTATYPGHEEFGHSEAINYLIVALNGEAGELSNKWKKVLRDKNGLPDFKFLQEAESELGDVLWYVAQLSQQIGTTLETLASGNLQKLASRKERGVISGSGDNR